MTGKDDTQSVGQLTQKFLQPNAQARSGAAKAKAKTTTAATFTTQQRRLIDQVFVMLQSNYRGLWSSAFATPQMLQAAKAQWLSRLVRFDECDVRAALSYWVDHNAMPPSLYDVLSLCRGEQARRRSNVKRLPAPWPPVNLDSVVKPCIAQMKKIARGI